MRLLLQRVGDAWVELPEGPTPRCGPGLVALAGFGQGDDATLLAPMAEKMVRLRIFPDDEGRMNRSLLDAGGGLVVVSQFTLYADARKGRRPSNTGALAPDAAARLFAAFVEVCRGWVPGVISGAFGATMRVHLINDGPVTIMLDSERLGLGGGEFPGAG